MSKSSGLTTPKPAGGVAAPVPEVTSPEIEALRARLAGKYAALKNSDAAVNSLSDLIVAATNGEAQAENGARLSVVDAVRGADALRQIHALLTDEVDKLEQRIQKELRVLSVRARS